MSLQNPPMDAVTDASGRFSIANIAPGRYELSAEHSGYVSQSFMQQHVEHAPLTLSFGQVVKDVMFKLEQTAVIDGHVYDEDGDPLRGASVQVLRRTYQSGRKTFVNVNGVRTDDRGAYRIFGLEPGRYYVRASSGVNRMYGDAAETSEPDYEPVFYPNGDSADHAAQMNLKAGDEIPDLNFQLMPSSARGYEVSGKVINPSAAKGTPNSFAALEDKNPEHDFTDGPVRRALVSPDGTFRFLNITPGEYEVTARGVLTPMGVGSPPLCATQSITVAGSNITRIALVLGPGANIAGHISFEGDLSASTGTVSINLSEEPGLFSGGAQVKPDGTFTISGVSDGTYEPNIYSRCGSCFIKAVRSRGADLGGKPIIVEGGAGPSPLEIIYSSNTAEVSGIVARGDKQPAAGALVALVPDPETPWRESRYRTANTDQYGHFDVAGAPPGTYTILAFAGLNDANLIQDPDFMQQYASTAQSLNLAEGDQKTLQLNLVSVNTP